MHRIDTDEPGFPSPTPGYFDSGDPLVPRLPTRIDKHWMNAVQEELVNAIEAAGITLVKGTWTQLRDAMGLNSGARGKVARYFENTLDISSGLVRALLLTAGRNSGGTARIVGTSTGSALELETTGAQSETLKITPSANTANDVAANVAAGVVKFTGANLGNSDGHTNALSALGLVKGWGHLTWNNGAPTLTSGMNMAAPGNPGGTSSGQIQVNLTDGIGAGAVVVTGNAGASAWHVSPVNTTGVVQVNDAAGAAVNFGATTGFAFLIVMGRQ